MLMNLLKEDHTGMTLLCPLNRGLPGEPPAAGAAPGKGRASHAPTFPVFLLRGSRGWAPPQLLTPRPHPLTGKGVGCGSLGPEIVRWWVMECEPYQHCSWRPGVW